jgi:hypothetical protein
MNPPPLPRSKVALWAGRVFSGLVVAFFIFDGSIKLVPLEPVFESMEGLGFAVTAGLARGLGALLLTCTLLYAWPRTALVGAVLLTGYLGGAIAIQLRAGSPVFSHLLFGVYVGVLMWAGLLLRDSRLRTLVLARP